MASKVEKQELAEEFIKIWKVEPSLWDVKSSLYKDRNAKARSFARFKDMLGMNGLFNCSIPLYLLFLIQPVGGR